MTTPTRAAGTRPIEDYALIGNCRSAALVGKDGAIDWLCWPRFDSPPVFAAILDPLSGGSWSIAPAGALARHATRAYVGATAVLRTTFRDDSVEVTLTDAMPITSPDDEKTSLSPENEILRIVTCVRGSAEIEVVFDPRLSFGKRTPRLVDRGKLGLRVEMPDGLLTLRSEHPLTVSTGQGATGRFVLQEGESAHFSLTHTLDAPAIIPPLGEWTRRVLAKTLGLWEEWSAKTRYDGPFREHVVRSAIVVRLLAYAPTGAIVAAPTTSLPETIGGKHNWDYRYCWLRDAAFTVRGMLALGHQDVAMAFTSWLLHATRLSKPKLMILYDVYGRAPPKESELDRVAGYAASRPVRTGNGADDQVQLDCYGEVIDAVWRVTRAGNPLDKETCSTIDAFGRYVCKHWREPDSGIWEPRSGPKQHTHSIVLCWVALDRLIDLQSRNEMRVRHRALFEDHRARIRREIERRGFNESLASYTAELDGDTLDATALLLGWYAYEEPSSARMKSTFDALVERLSPAPGLLYRYRGEGDDEGAFGICSFWMAEHLAQGGGTHAEACASFEKTLAYGNDVGLFSEEIDPRSGSALGNFPQNFTHVGLINAALSIDERARRDAGESEESTP